VFYLNSFFADPDPDQNFNADPDPGCQSNSDLDPGLSSLGDISYEYFDIFPSFHSTGGDYYLLKNTE
jgi:hypothetical protein